MLNLKKKIIELFAQHGHEKSPEAEANLILFNAFRNKYQTIQKLSEIYTERSASRFPLTKEIEQDAMRMAGERVKGIPLQHVTGNQFFYEHDYKVNANVLIPRQETEILIREVINYTKKTFGNKPFRFAELGLGSGILSSEILFHFKNALGLASEVSPQAIALARDNLDHIMGVGNWEDRLSIIEPGDSHIGFEIFEDYKPMDIIISNPPYVSVNDEVEAEVLRHEPHTALFPMIGGAANAGEKENPNFFYESFLHHHQKILKPDGIAFFEVPHERASSIQHEFRNAGFRLIMLVNDLTDRPRVLIAQKK